MLPSAYTDFLSRRSLERFDCRKKSWTFKGDVCEWLYMDFSCGLVVGVVRSRRYAISIHFIIKLYLNLNVFTPPVGYGYIIVTETRIEISLKQSTPEAASYCSTIEMAHYNDWYTKHPIAKSTTSASRSHLSTIPLSISSTIRRIRDNVREVYTMIILVEPKLTSPHHYILLLPSSTAYHNTNEVWYNLLVLTSLVRVQASISMDENLANNIGSLSLP